MVQNEIYSAAFSLDRGGDDVERRRSLGQRMWMGTRNCASYASYSLLFVYYVVLGILSKMMKHATDAPMRNLPVGENIAGRGGQNEREREREAAMHRRMER